MERNFSVIGAILDSRSRLCLDSPSADAGGDGYAGRSQRPYWRRLDQRFVSRVYKSHAKFPAAIFDHLPYPKYRMFNPIIQFDLHESSPILAPRMKKSSHAACDESGHNRSIVAPIAARPSPLPDMLPEAKNVKSTPLHLGPDKDPFAQSNHKKSAQSCSGTNSPAPYI